MIYKNFRATFIVLLLFCAVLLNNAASKSFHTINIPMQSKKIFYFSDGGLMNSREAINLEGITKEQPSVVVQKQYREYFRSVVLSLQQRITHFINGMIDSTFGIFSCAKMMLTSTFVPTETEKEIAAAPISKTWAGLSIIEKELSNIQVLRNLVDFCTSCGSVAIRRSVHDIELLRFLRSAGGRVDHAWSLLQAHIEWRTSLHSPEVVKRMKALQNSPLRHELFWLGVNEEGCAVLVLRTQVHDGRFFNEDPHLYNSYMVSVLEEGRRLYGVGVERQVCLVIDRGGSVRRNGVPKAECRDMAVVPKVVELVRTLLVTVQTHYPDLLHSAKIVPSTWFFSMCYRVISSVFDAHTRSKFTFIGEGELVEKLHSNVPAHLLPTHLGGTSRTYLSDIDVAFDSAAYRHTNISRILI